MTDDVFSRHSANCDERIALLQSKMSAYGGYKELKEKIENLDDCVKLVKVEKLVGKALSNPNSKRDIFKALLKKYDELMLSSYDISGNLVEYGVVLEGDYIAYCKSSLVKREFIRDMCSRGYKGYLK